MKGPGSGPAKGRTRDTETAGEGKEPSPSLTVHQAEYQGCGVSQAGTYPDSLLGKMGNDKYSPMTLSIKWELTVLREIGGTWENL